MGSLDAAESDGSAHSNLSEASEPKVRAVGLASMQGRVGNSLLPFDATRLAEGL